MLVSIVVPVLNEASILEDTLVHLRRRVDGDPGRSEIVVVDGHSDDRSAEIVRRHGIRLVEAPRGRARQMNTGAGVALGELLLFLHADTRLPDGALEAVRDAVRGGAVGGYFGVRLDSDRPLLRLTGTLITWRSRLTGGAAGDQAIFATREAFESLDGYASMELFEDLDLLRRLRGLGEMVALPSSVVTSARRWEDDGAWRTILRMWALRLLYLCGVEPDRLVRFYGPAR